MSIQQEPFVGMEKREIDTPALLIDLDVMEANIKAMADYVKSIGVNLRPHVKTHKSTIIAHKQIAAGAIGITCAKLGEAETLVEAGISDILIANQIVGPLKIARLVNLTKHADMMVAVDNPDNVRELAAASAAKGVRPRVLLEVNIGMDRCGVVTKEEALDLARLVTNFDSLRFAGIMGFEGGVVELANRAERTRRATICIDRLAETKQFLEKHGIPVAITSGGGSGTYDISGSRPEMTEIQAGTYVFMDATYLKVEGMEQRFGPALTVLATVISRPTSERLHTDGGHKSISKEFGIPQPYRIDGLEQKGLSEEHGNCRVLKPLELKVGDKIEILPSHACTTVNLHDRYYAIRDGRVEAIWKVAARGKAV